MTDGDSVTINHLCDSANGTFVTLDDDLLLTRSLQCAQTRVSVGWATGKQRFKRDSV